MPRSLGSALPAALAAALDGRRLAERVGDTYLLITTSEAGWPHVAMLSAGEVLAIGESALRLALWPQSRSTANLRRSGQALLTAVVPPAMYYVRLRIRPLADLARLAAFEAAIEAVEEDIVDYARLTEAIRFELANPAEVLTRWSATIAALRALASA
jgi:hypothetical protein